MPSNLQKLANQPLQGRTPVGYNRKFLDDYRSNAAFYLPESTSFFELAKTDGFERPNVVKCSKGEGYVLDFLLWSVGKRYMSLAIVFFYCFFSFSFSDIYVFGDSHSGMFSYLPSAKIHHIGPITMHRIGRDGLEILDWKRFGVNSKDVVLCVFGEIDVRCHIQKISQKSQLPSEDIIKNLVSLYLRTILQNKLKCPPMKIIVCGAMFPVDETATNNNPDFPFIGTLKERILLTRLLNSELELQCTNHRIDFFDIPKFFDRGDGALNVCYSDNTVHVGENWRHVISEWFLEKFDTSSVIPDQGI